MNIFYQAYNISDELFTVLITNDKFIYDFFQGFNTSTCIGIGMLICFAAYNYGAIISWSDMNGFINNIFTSREPIIEGFVDIESQNTYNTPIKKSVSELKLACDSTINKDNAIIFID